MNGSDWFDSLPEAIEGKPTPQEIATRERAILDAVIDGNYVILWTPVAISEKLTIFVSSDALKIGCTKDAIRVCASCKTQQRIADEIGAYLLTPKLVDDIWVESTIKIEPQTQPISASKYAMQRHNDAIEELRAGRCGIVSGWKDWVIGERLWREQNKALNYGWHVETTADTWKGIKLHDGAIAGKVIQPVSGAHDVNHVDYSQLCRFVRKKALYDGQMRDLAELVSDPLTAKAITTEGQLPGMRHPGISANEPEPEQIPPRTYPGDKGPKVVAWQSFLISYFAELGQKALPKYGADGDHGGETEDWTQRYEQGNEDTIPFVQARNYTPANRTHIKWIMIHTMEASEKPGTAEAVASWFAGPSAPRASAHYCVDNDSIVQCVRDQDVAWACGGANRFGLHIELAGRAAQDAAGWADDYSKQMLARAVGLCKDLAREWSIPVVKLSPQQMRGGVSGFVGHIDGTIAFRKSTHVDPGKSFPWEKFLLAIAE